MWTYGDKLRLVLVGLLNHTQRIVSCRNRVLREHIEANIASTARLVVAVGTPLVNALICGTVDLDRCIAIGPLEAVGDAV